MALFSHLSIKKTQCFHPQIIAISTQTCTFFIPKLRVLGFPLNFQGSLAHFVMQAVGRLPPTKKFWFEKGEIWSEKRLSFCPNT